MKSIALVLVYFGKKPNYFELWLKSAEYNSSIDFFIFTDLNISETANIHVKRITFDDFKDRVNNKFSFECILNTPYKICDYRPAFGVIFDEELREYDYWGYVDSDVIFGNLRKFLTNEILDNYDRFSNLGHLTVFRNTQENNRKFMFSKCGMYYSYKEAFQIAENTAFDELGGMKWLSDIGYIKAYTDYKYIADIFPTTYHFRTYYNYYSDKRHIYRFHKGKLTALYEKEENLVDEIEMMYIHLQARKMVNVATSNTEYLILPNRFEDDRTVDVGYIVSENEGKAEDVLSFKSIPKIQMSLILKIKKFLRRRIYMNRKFN